jgi:hypothetical protein
MHASRGLLDPEYDTVTLSTLRKAALAVRLLVGILHQNYRDLLSSLTFLFSGFRSLLQCAYEPLGIAGEGLILPVQKP